MAPTKRRASTAAASAKDAVKSRCTLVKKAVEQSHEVEDRVKQLLSSTLAFTAGTPKADRHPFNERFVAMIGQVLEGEQTRLTTDVASKEAAFSELSPGKPAREAAVEEAKAGAAAQKAALDAAKQAVIDVAASVKAANTELAVAQKAQHSGDEELEGISGLKTKLEEVFKDSFAPLMEGLVDADGTAEKTKAVMSAGKSFGFDSSLMSTAAQVLQKPAAERGTFDATCFDAVRDAFNGSIAKFDEQLASGAPAKAERASAVESAEATKAAAEASHVDLKEKAAAAKEEKTAADAAAKASTKSLEDFMPDLKAAGDALDNARQALQSFVDGPHIAFNELKEFQEGDFDKKPEPEPEEVAEAPQEGESPSKMARLEEAPVPA